MTIKELIEQLEEFDEDTDIVVSWDGFTVDPIDRIEETEDYRAVIRLMEYRNLEEEDMDELDMLRSENEALRMRLAEIRERVNGMELPHEYHILYTRGWHDAVEEVRRYIE